MIVDDEEMVITSIKAFLQLETDFDIQGFTDPEAGRAISPRTTRWTWPSRTT